MENENIETIDSQNDTEETVISNEESDNTETEGTDVDIEAEVKKATASLYARMKKAEEEAREAKAKLAQTSGKSDKTSGDLSQKDVIYLAKSDIHDEDMDEVLNYASKAGLSVKEAHEYLKPILMNKQELRKSAAVANTGNVRRGVSKVSGESLLEKARSGDVPNDPDALAKARFEEMKNKNKR